jgi:hypothetical protein
MFVLFVCMCVNDFVCLFRSRKRGEYHLHRLGYDKHAADCVLIQKLCICQCFSVGESFLYVYECVCMQAWKYII